MNNQRIEEQGWYEPLQQQETAAGRPVQHETASIRKKKKRKGLTPGRIAGIVVLLLLLIAGSSLAFQGLGGGRDAADDGFGIEIPEFGDEEMPKKAEDFFEQYYVMEDRPNNAAVKIERVKQQPDFLMALTPRPEEELSLQDLYEKCAPTIVSISGYEGSKAGYAWGSGVIVSEDGLILTNAHILERYAYLEKLAQL